MPRRAAPVRHVFVLRLVLTLAALALPAPARAEVVYSNDFEGTVGPEWSRTNTERTPVGDRGFLGQFGAETVTLSLNNLPPHSQLTVSFDLFLLRSWDGSGEDEFGPDTWSLAVDGGPRLIHTSFSFPGYTTSWQSFPGQFPSAL